MGHNSSEPNVKKLKKKRDIRGLIEAASGWSGSLEAVEILGEIGDKDAIPALTKAMKDPDTGRAAREALEEIQRR